MADETDIASLTEVGVIKSTDEFVVQKVGEDLFKKAPISKIVGGWKNISKPILDMALDGVSDPVMAIFGPSGGVKQRKFIIGNEVFFTLPINHDIALSSTVHPFVKFSTDGVLTTTVKWELEYMVANRDLEPAFPAPTVVNLELAAKATAWANQFVEDATGFTAPEVDGLVLCHLKRITNGGTDNTNGVFPLSVGLHYQVQQNATPNKAPNFYV